MKIRGQNVDSESIVNKNLTTTQHFLFNNNHWCLLFTPTLKHFIYDT